MLISYPESLDCDGQVVSLPDGLVHITILTSSQLVLHHDISPANINHQTSFSSSLKSLILVKIFSLKLFTPIQFEWEVQRKAERGVTSTHLVILCQCWMHNNQNSCNLTPRQLNDKNKRKFSPYNTQKVKERLRKYELLGLRCASLRLPRQRVEDTV